MKKLIKLEAARICSRAWHWGEKLR